MGKRVAAKLDGDVREAVRIISSDESMTPYYSNNLDLLFDKHPRQPANLFLPQPPDLNTPVLVDTENDILEILKSFALDLQLVLIDCDQAIWFLCTAVPQQACTVLGSPLDSGGVQLCVESKRRELALMCDRFIQIDSHQAFFLLKRFQCVSMTASDSSHVTRWIGSQTTKRRSSSRKSRIPLFDRKSSYIYLCP
ncbi:hypothetical protein GJ496_003826 [Pomphorhynchus laevis]|nr:hypothetical protein GJ496_003826 [Pomphorhynchus laevis]